ncbi:MAG: hypothetical protein AABY32_05860 [Nanoarchaeota archaeon]
MPVQNASQIKEKILSTLKIRGPTIPVYLAKEAGVSMLFASAFLSELLSDRKVKMSHMRVGNSPVYYIPGQETQLERFSNHLKSKEKDAFLLLQRKKFLKDSEQSPAIRVALREIKDFAFHFRINDEVFWRYLTTPESEFKQEIKPIEEHKYIEAKPKPFDKEERKLGDKIIKDIKIEDIEEIRKDNEKLEKKKEIEKEENIELAAPEKPKEEIKIEEIPQEKKKEEREVQAKAKHSEEKPKKIKQIKTPKKKSTQKKDNKFFEKIKEFLSKETIEIINVESFKKNEILLRIKSEGKEKLLVAYNKKKISDTDIINANKKASQLNLKYTILSMGEPSKKLSSLIESVQNLEKIEKIEK